MADHGSIVAAEHNLVRSPHWPAVERAHIVLEPACRCCKPGQSTVKPQVHHRFPFHFCILLGRPELEIYQGNLISLCETEHDNPAPNHHLLVGHFDDFQSSNVDVVNDALRTWYGWTETQIQADAHWKLKHEHRLKKWNDMTETDKRDFRAQMDHVFPVAVVKAAMEKAGH